MRLKLLLVTGIAFMVVGCATPYIGMTEKEFRASRPLGLTIEAMNAPGNVIYRYWEWGSPVALYTFYYFQDGRLVQMDRGQPQQFRVQQEIVNR